LRFVALRKAFNRI